MQENTLKGGSKNMGSRMILYQRNTKKVSWVKILQHIQINTRNL